MGLGLPMWLDSGAIAASNLTAFITCLAVTAAVCSLARVVTSQRQILLDDELHAGLQIPRAGGVAALAGIIAGAALMTFSGEPIPWLELVCASLLSLMGFMDDLDPQDPLLALTFQGTIGAGLGWSLGPTVWWMVLGVAVAAMLVTTTRLMDGIDGLAAETTILWGVACAWLGMATGRHSLTLLGLLAASAALGFLPWNARNARLYLGDSGRYLLGGIFTGGTITALAEDWRVGVLLVAPLSVHLVDVISTWVLERTHHRPRSAPHRERVYQRLSDELGLTHARTRAVVLGIAGAVTLVWFLAPWFLAMPASIVLLALYLDLPRLISLRRDAAA